MVRNLSARTPLGTPRVLIIRRRYLGDVVLLGSVLRNLRLHWPESHLSVLVEPAYADVLALNPDADAALIQPHRLRDWPDFLQSLRRARFTHVFDFDNTEKTALLTSLSGAGFRLALHNSMRRLRLPGAYTDVVHVSSEEYEGNPITDYYLRALAPAGVPVISRDVRLTLREADIAAMRRMIGNLESMLLVHPGSRSPWRLWPAERFAAICDRVQSELGVRVMLVGGVTEQTLIAEIQRHARTGLLAFPLAPSLHQLAALAHLSRALLCHDSGPMHIAAIVGTPVVALHGSQNATVFPPLGQGHTVLQPPLPCRGCVAPGQCVPGDSYRTCCVRRIATDEVFAAVAAKLSSQRATPTRSTDRWCTPESRPVDERELSLPNVG